MYSYVCARARTVSNMKEAERTPGEVLTMIREKKGLSLRAVALRSGLSHGTIHNLEAKDGSYADIRAGTIRKAAFGYGISQERFRDIIERRGVDFMEPSDVAAHLRVHPDWIAFPVRETVSAGDADAGYVTGEVAYIPREHLRRKGAMPENVDVYQVNGNCMISPEARNIEKNIADGDYVAVDRHRAPDPGDVVVAWWPDAGKLVVKRYRIEGENIVLYPVAPGHPTIVLPGEESLNILGRVVWRGG